MSEFPRVNLVSDIPSPCIGVCRLDLGRQLCEGCMRTTQEIARWPYADTARAAGDPAAAARAPPGGRADQRRGQPAAPARQGECSLIMTTTFDTLLAARPVLLADGGMGTGLFALGLSTGDSPELWNVEHPDRIATCIAASSRRAPTSSSPTASAAAAHRLKLHQAQDRVAELNHGRRRGRPARWPTQAGRPVRGRRARSARPAS